MAKVSLERVVVSYLEEAALQDKEEALNEASHGMALDSAVSSRPFSQSRERDVVAGDALSQRKSASSRCASLPFKGRSHSNEQWFASVHRQWRHRNSKVVKLATCRWRLTMAAILFKALFVKWKFARTPISSRCDYVTNHLPPKFRRCLRPPLPAPARTHMAAFIERHSSTDVTLNAQSPGCFVWLTY